MQYEGQGKLTGFAVGSFAAWIATALIFGGMIGCPNYNRYQVRQDATNQIQVNNLLIQQTAQLVDVEKQKAEIRPPL